MTKMGGGGEKERRWKEARRKRRGGGCVWRRGVVVYICYVCLDT